VKEIRRDVKVVDSFSNLIIETIGSDSDVLNSAAAFEMG